MSKFDPRNVLLKATRGMIHTSEFPMGMALTAEGGKEIARLKHDGIGGMDPTQRRIVRNTPTL